MNDVAKMPAIEIYTREFCGYCDAAKELLRRKGVIFTEIDVTGNRERRALGAHFPRNRAAADIRFLFAVAGRL